MCCLAVAVVFPVPVDAVLSPLFVMWRDSNADTCSVASPSSTHAHMTEPHKCQFVALALAFNALALTFNSRRTVVSGTWKLWRSSVENVTRGRLPRTTVCSGVLLKMEVGIRKRARQRDWRYPTYLWSLRWVYAVKKPQRLVYAVYPRIPPPPIHHWLCVICFLVWPTTRILNYKWLTVSKREWVSSAI